MNLDIDTIYEGHVPDAIIKLTCPSYTGTQFISPVVGDLVIGGQVVTDDIFGNYGADKRNKLRSGIEGIQQAAGAAGIGANLSSVSQYLNKHRWQTVQLYQDSSGGDLSLQMVFIVTGRNSIDRYRQAIELTSCTFPDTDFDPSGSSTRQAQAEAKGKTISYSDAGDPYHLQPVSLNQLLKAPCGYTIGADGMPKGTWNIQIGSYFLGGGFILKSANMTQSKERLGQSEALIATVDCQFEPSLAVTSSQFLSWFGGV